MYPMDFEEFLYANGVGEPTVSQMRQNFTELRGLPAALHDKIMDLFKKYLIVGGFPKAVEAFVNTHNVANIRAIQHETHALYGIDASKYEAAHGARLKIQRIYDMVPSSLEQRKKRIVIKEIEDKSWKRSSHYIDEFDYLISSGITLCVKAISTPSYPLAQNSGKNLLKLYINDVGILSNLYYRTNIKAIMDSHNSLNLGALYETVVAQELKAHGHDLFYYDNKKNGEVDFLIDDADSLSVIPIEVKSGKDYIVHSALDRFLACKEYHIQRAFVLSNTPDVYTKNGITYLPIYYTMFFSNDCSHSKQLL